MRYTLPLAGFLMVVMATSYYAPHIAEALTSTNERCDIDICRVQITKDGFVPKTLIVKIGTTIIWTNTDDGRHTVTSGSPGEITAPLKSLLLEKDQTYEFTFEYSGLYQGSYKYFDQITKTMRGEIIVEPETKKAETPTKPKVQTLNVDFNDPKSGVKKVSFPTGTIKSMEIDPDSRSLIITVEGVQSGGKLEITIDRTLIDARNNAKDDHFVVMVDEHEGFFDETTSTPTERTLRIVVPVGSEKIEIVGTQVLPEFPVAMLAIAGVFTAMIAAYRLGTRF